MDYISFTNICAAGLLALAGFLVYIIATGSRSMRNYLLSRLALSIPTIWILVTLIFIMMRVVPGDPVQARLKPGSINLIDLQERIGLKDVEREVVTINYSYPLADIADELEAPRGDTPETDFLITDADEWEACGNDPLGEEQTLNDIHPGYATGVDDIQASVFLVCDVTSAGDNQVTTHLLVIDNAYPLDEFFDERGLQREGHENDFLITSSSQWERCGNDALSNTETLSDIRPGYASALDDNAELYLVCDITATDVPLYKQYIDYLGGLLRLDLGESINVEPGRPVIEIIERRIPATLELTVPAVLIMLIVGIYTGAFSAHHHRGSQDYILRISSVMLYSIPIFWMGLMFQLLFARELGLLPVANRFTGRIPFEVRTGFYFIDSLLAGDLASTWIVLRHMFLPTLTLALALIGVFIRLTRSNMIEVLQEDYVTAARARGVPERRVVYRHALRNSFIPIMTFIGLQVAVLMGGAILTETTFSWDGMGKLIRDGIADRDFFVVQGGVTIFAVIVGIISTLTDILYAFIDPRIRY